MDNYTIYINVIIVLKICFILMAITHIYLKSKGETNSDLDKKIVYWKERFEFGFITLMAILLIYLFNPKKYKMFINGETKILLYLFGIVLLITAKWSTFFYEAKWLQCIQKSVGKNKSR